MLPRDNRSKKNLTLYQDSKFQGSYELSENILDLMIYPRESELRFLDLSIDQKRNSYIEFLSNRRNTLVNKIKKNISDYYNI